eukprot:CAMPEP_0119382144 /NCGR_PEP_ID=MMETSP1334-20130426/69990_1 /TAXON_ID=127549 /ORGANISM="Calcidiscus leptoporus, Strain RCC1130" /LENGTH=92 /DNA_ID=CAMNT_0007402497 /DNA_START=186 /DNA_END=464 /DNA_ORIENTATION=+
MCVLGLFICSSSNLMQQFPLKIGNLQLTWKRFEIVVEDRIRRCLSQSSRAEVLKHEHHRGSDEKRHPELQMTRPNEHAEPERNLGPCGDGYQ